MPVHSNAASPDGIQYFLERAHWDVEAARDILCDYVTDHLGDEQGILIVDKTGFIKKAPILLASNANIAVPPDG
ncbi:transposase [Xenorhabdus beddingii]|uniref:Transposase n=1 Tax=Xenorhabdus beddingii TaxID=40578 RepID=A0A1Y2SU19_9GAMM|nr:transposase [Xenorhabdus beddingii]OTA21882.1 transposase [Xenorhabdus beddingii]